MTRIRHLQIKELAKHAIIPVLDSLAVPHTLAYADLATQAKRIRDHSRSVTAGTGQGGSRIVFFTVRGRPATHYKVDGILAQALRLRGAETRVYMCGQALPACDSVLVTDYQDPTQLLRDKRPATCHICNPEGIRFLRTFGVDVGLFSELIDPLRAEQVNRLAKTQTLRQCLSFEYDGVHIGEHVQASLLRFLIRGTLEDDQYTIAVARRLLAAGILLVEVGRHILRSMRPDCVVAHHGIYVTSGVLCEVARAEGIPVVIWGGAYRPHTILLSHGETYHHEMRHEPEHLWDRCHLTKGERAVLERFFAGGWKRSADLASYHTATVEDTDYVAEQLQVDRSKPLVGLFTNVLWDARVNYSDVTTFPGPLEWVLETVRHFAARPEVQLVVRVHPAELRHALCRSQQLVADEICKVFPSLPDHIKIIGPDSDLNSYALASLIDVGLVHTTKIGLEMAARGIPVVVAGEALYANKGFTVDVRSQEEYFNLLEDVRNIRPATSDWAERAKRYAYHFYFRRSIPFPTLYYDPKTPELYVRRLEDLAPGKNPHLDVICEGVLEGKPFITDGYGWDS